VAISAIKFLLLGRACPDVFGRESIKGDGKFKSEFDKSNSYNNSEIFFRTLKLSN